jgi:hypothetical protein
MHDSLAAATILYVVSIDLLQSSIAC